MNDKSLDIDNYSRDRATHYEAHHRKNLRTNLTTRRELALLESALRASGSPAQALDLPCGTGRFWPAFAAAGVSEILASDNSEGMLDVAERSRSAVSVPVKLFRTSLFEIDLPDSAVPAIACMRFFHHLSRAEDRRTALAELSRVSSQDVIVSLWTDGCVQSWFRRRRREKPEVKAGYGKRTCIERTTFEAEVSAAGFKVVSRHRVWPGLSMWTFYHLRKNTGV